VTEGTAGLGLTPTPDTGERLTEVRVWDEATRPTAPARRHPGDLLTPAFLAELRQPRPARAARARVRAHGDDLVGGGAAAGEGG